MKINNSIIDLIGNTPMVKINKLFKNSNVFAKIEYFNPTGSSKDRIAYKMIKDAIDNGVLKENSVIIEPTSGNTGIGIAAYGAVLGYKVIIVMPDSMSVERRKMISAYGAEIVLTPGKDGMKGAVTKAEELSKEYQNSFIPSQFENASNPKAHFETTGPEIWEQTDGKVDIFVASVGTGGTISGTAKYLKSKNKDIKIIAVEPEASPLLSKGIAGPHKIQGIGANFVPNTLDKSIIDEIITVSNEDAYEFTRKVAKDEGLLVGISSGAVLSATSKVINDNIDKNIVVLLPDSGVRYISTENLFKEEDL